MDFENYKHRIFNNLPLNIQKNLNLILEDIVLCSKLTEHYSVDLIDKYCYELIIRFEDHTLKPIPMMRKLQTLNQWAVMINNGITKGVPLSVFEDVTIPNKLWNLFMAEISAGHSVNLPILLDRIAKNQDKVKEKEYKDITSPNIIVELGEIVKGIEDLFDKEISNISLKLQRGEYSEIEKFLLDDNILLQRTIDNAGINNDKNCGFSQIFEDMEKKRQLIRKLELYKLFSPLFKELNIIISIMPVILTMLFDDMEGLDKIREDCNNIFMELSTGAELERITLSLREKLGKNREIEDIKINAVAISKIIKKIKDALNFNIFSNLRRLKVRTIIEDTLFHEASEIGLSLFGLNSIYGLARAPIDFHDMILESTRYFSDSILNLKNLIKPRLPEEIGVIEKPNLTILYDSLSKIQNTIEKYFLMIPLHIGPIYSGTIQLCADEINNLSTKLSPIREKMLTKIFIDENQRKVFYEEINIGIQKINQTVIMFEDFFEIGLKLTNIDQNIALEFSDKGDDLNYYEEGYQTFFDQSIHNINRMYAMKTLREEEINPLMSKIQKGKIALGEFKKRWNHQNIKHVLERGRTINSLVKISCEG